MQFNQQDSQPEVSEHFVSVRHRKIFYTLQKIDDARVQLKCPAAEISRVIMNKDLPDWLMNLPRHVLENKKKQEKEYPHMIRFRVSKEDKEVIEKTAFDEGYASVSDYLRSLTLGDESGVRAYGRNRV